MVGKAGEGRGGRNGKGRTLEDLSGLALLDLHLVYVAFVVTSYWGLGESV